MKKLRFHPALIALLSTWLLAMLLVDPRGEFPLNDDFSFAKSVYNLCVEGRVLFDDWLAMTFVAQWLWGNGWCEVFGFSFTVLRLSTLVLATVGLMVLYELLREIGASHVLAVFLALVLAFNPLFFSLSFTFMTDVPFAALLLLALWAWWRWYQHQGRVWFTAALAISVLALMLRQTGLMLLLALPVWRWHHTRRLGPTLLATWPILCGLALLYAWTRWLEGHQGLPDTWADPLVLIENATKFGKWEVASRRLPALGGTLGLFLLPVFLGLRTWRWIQQARRRWLVVLAGALLLANGLWWHQAIPWGNIFYNLGLGPKLLKDGQFFLNVYPQLGPSALLGLQVLAAFSGAWLGMLVLACLRSWLENPFGSFLLVCTSAYLLFAMLDTHSFDRYWLVFFPLLLCLFAMVKVAQLPPAPNAVSWLLLGAMALFSLLATHDYLAWNRARWQALHWLADEGIPPERIDGGFEFNGWHRPGVLEHGRARSWWWVHAEDYCVTFGQLEGFTTVRAFTWSRWLPPGQDSILVIHKDGRPE